jgi:hypothetical protein
MTVAEIRASTVGTGVWNWVGEAKGFVLFMCF